MICEQGVEGALPPLGEAVPKPLLVFLMTDLGLLYYPLEVRNKTDAEVKRSEAILKI
jgi:hypothetical protein